MKSEAEEIEKVKDAIQKSSENIKLAQTDIIAPKRVKRGKNAMDRVSLSFTAREDTECGTYWRTHPLQVKFDRCVRTFHQHQEEHAEATVKLKGIEGFAQGHIDNSSKRWADEEISIKTRKRNLISTKKSAQMKKWK